MAVNSLENKRIQNINFIMNDIHDSSNDIYEMLVDKDIPQLKVEINGLIKKLKHVLDSVEDEL